MLILFVIDVQPVNNRYNNLHCVAKSIFVTEINIFLPIIVNVLKFNNK